jgi:transcription elongation factor Elf1
MLVTQIETILSKPSIRRKLDKITRKVKTAMAGYHPCPKCGDIGPHKVELVSEKQVGVVSLRCVECWAHFRTPAV